MKNQEQDTHLKNAKKSASAAPNYEDYQAWIAAGADPEASLNVQAIAVAYLPPKSLDLLASIALASHNPDGLARHDERASYAMTQPAQAIAAVVDRLVEVEDWLDQGGEGAPPNGAAFGPVPSPRNDDDRFRP